MSAQKFSDVHNFQCLQKQIQNIPVHQASYKSYEIPMRIAECAQQ